MSKQASVFFVSLFVSGAVSAQQLDMVWGLENEWSYKELVVGRTWEQDAAYKPPSEGTRYRTFAFKEGVRDIDEPRFECVDRHFRLWDAYQGEIDSGQILPPPESTSTDSDYARQAFVAYKNQRDPFCAAHAEKQAPVLYFDFVADSASQFVLRHIEITTLRFSEYRAGGFVKDQAGYDIVLPHNEGTKIVKIDKKLRFKESGRIELRLWSDNYIPKQGWIAGAGEYLIDIRFVFKVAGETASVETGPFKIDLM